VVQTISKIYVKQDSVNEFIELFKAMIEPTKKEAGCIQYDMYQDEEDATILIVLEQWESRESFDQHLESEHFKEIGPKMSELMAKESELNVAYKIA